MKTWISPKVNKGLPSVIHGNGLFATSNIVKDEIVAIKNGHILSLQEVESFPSRNLHSELQLSDDLFIGPKDESEIEDSLAYINHSCEPNLGMRGDIVGVAIRDIKKGEEIVQDYAMIDSRDYKFKCTCGSTNCRNIITGQDWKIYDLQEKYQGYFSAFITSKIKIKDD